VIEACLKAQLDWLKYIISFITTIKTIQETVANILVPIYKVVEISQMVAAVFLNPATLGLITQTLVGYATSLLVSMLTQMLRDWLNSLNLNCLLSGAQDVISALFGVMGGVRDAGAQLGTLAQFTNDKIATPAKKALEDPEQAAKNFFGIDNPEEEENWNRIKENGGQGLVDLLGDHTRTVGESAINSFAETMGFRSRTGSPLANFTSDASPQVAFVGLGSIDLYDSLLASPLGDSLGPGVRQAMSAYNGLLQSAKSTTQALFDAGREVVDLALTTTEAGALAFGGTGEGVADANVQAQEVIDSTSKVVQQFFAIFEVS